jgi:hypothetical protein
MVWVIDFIKNEWMQKPVLIILILLDCHDKYTQKEIKNEEINKRNYLEKEWLHRNAMQIL